VRSTLTDGRASAAVQARSGCDEQPAPTMTARTAPVNRSTMV
jgi:hypothetical protein